MVHRWTVALARSDAKLLVLAAGGVILAGVLVAAVLLLATGRASSPTKYTAFPAGDATAIRNDLEKGGPFFFPDPFGGDRNILLALEGGKVVALSDIKPGTEDCRVRWKGSRLSRRCFLGNVDPPSMPPVGAGPLESERR